MVDNSVLFANLLAVVASLMECIEINFAILTTTISHFIQIVESFSSRRRGAKCLGFEPRQRWFWVRPSQTSACSYDAVAEPDLQIGGPVSKKSFFGPLGPRLVWKERGPSPESVNGWDVSYCWLLIFLFICRNILLPGRYRVVQLHESSIVGIKVSSFCGAIILTWHHRLYSADTYTRALGRRHFLKTKIS